MPSSLDDAVSWLHGQLGSMEDALSALVEVNSFTDNAEGGRRVGALLRELFALQGLDHQVISSDRYADHWVFRAEGEKPPLAILGHLDTVFPPGKFEGYRREGNLRRGPGVFDMKGGLVVVAFALKALARVAPLPSLRLVIVSDEEVGSPEGQGVIRSAIEGCDAALVFESGRAGDAIVTQRKGTGGVNATAHGKAAHAGNAHAEGSNAIWALARFIDAAQQLTDYPRGVTLNVGKVSGGQGKNTVPDSAEAQLDLRFCTHADGEELMGRVREAASEAAKTVPGTRIELTGGIAREPMERSDASVALMNAYGACAREAGLQFSEAALVGGGSDASTSSSMGIPSIDGLGPRGKGFHTVEEQIQVDSLIPKSEALLRFLMRRVRSRGLSNDAIERD